ncbi:MAG: acetyl-CoA carboxylase biotin carboxylase subunit, partial [Opitutae bacterium]|nr:acetyl-CoA carboxylase biotin carboxylase subunit [Opitutae bacterium]
VQRRHQKIIEEAPSPFLSPEMRKTMGRAAVKAAQAAEYQNAGTVEFLVDSKKNFYFIEMNTRIQVEHGVTEEVTGIDLVKEQLTIAANEKLAFDQRSIKFQRHSIECRICAEDPVNNFLPSPGEIELYFAPGGHGVRVDSHVYSGYKISPHYDSMISKLITFGRNRSLALDRMERALGEYIIRGKNLRNNIPFCRAIIKDPVFRAGKATTRYVEDFLARTPNEMFTPKA